MFSISVIQYHPPLEDSKFLLVQFWMGKFTYKIMFQLLVQIICSPNIYADNSSDLLQFCIHSYASFGPNLEQAIENTFPNIIQKLLLTNICHIDTSISARKLVRANLKTHHTDHTNYWLSMIKLNLSNRLYLKKNSNSFL